MAILCTSLSCLSASASDKPDAQNQNATDATDLDIAGFLETDTRTTLFHTALRTSNLWHIILESDEATIFVPTDSALRTEGSAFLLEVVLLKQENSGRLDDLVAQHWIPDEAVLIDELVQPTNFLDQRGGCLPVAPLLNATKIGAEAFVTDLVKASNGNIYFIDRLLWRPYQDVGCRMD